MAASVVDHYEVLGVSQDADIAQIKKAYKKLAIKCHPDKNPGDKNAEETFKLVSAAYAVLSDDAKRAEYDQAGRTPMELDEIHPPQAFFSGTFNAHYAYFGGVPHGFHAHFVGTHYQQVFDGTVYARQVFFCTNNNFDAYRS